MSTNNNLTSKIPKEVSYVTDTLDKAGFETYLVGGCVRDLIMDRAPKDWDVTTNAKPEEIIKLFEKTVYENTFGTVGVYLPAEALAEEDVIRETTKNKVNSSEKHPQNVPHETPEYFVVEVTPYRIEAKYSDFRHPDEVKFSKKLEDDLKRRDFTVNSLALDSKGHVKDLYEGLKDIKAKSIRAVGEADERFNEDALRMLRAVRFSVQLDFSIAHETSLSILKNSELIKKISAERIHDEFVKIIMSKNPAAGVVMLQKFGLLKHIIPELEEGIGCEQLGEHIYDVWGHLLHALQHAADKNWALEIRLAALFHDIGKPKTRRIALQEQALRHESGGENVHEGGLGSATARARGIFQQKNIRAESENIFSRVAKKIPKDGKKKYTFYGHEVVGARMAKKIMERLKFSKKETDLVEKLVRNHMFFSDPDLITLSAVRRIIAKVGKENIWQLMSVRECDRVGMKKKEAPYRLRKYFAMIEEALRDPISVNQLKIDGNFMMKELGIKAGPRMGWILSALLEEVLDAPEKNTLEHLSELVKSLNLLGDGELKALGDRGKEKKEELEGEEIDKLHSKHGVARKKSS